MADQELRQVLQRLTIAPAAAHTGRFIRPMRVCCPGCSQQLGAGWGRYWHCDTCGTGGDAVDYLRATGLSFAQAREVLLTEAEGWRSWERRMLREAVSTSMVLASLEIPLSGRMIRCPNAQAHRYGDRRPSCAVYDDGVRCFGCGFSGDVFTVWQKLHGCDFRTAWNELLFLAQRSTEVVPARSAESPRLALNGQDFVPLYDEVLACCAPLPATAGATYLASRGIDAEAANHLGVRWVSNIALGRIQALLAAVPHETAVVSGLLDTRGRFTLRGHRLLFPARWDGHTVWLQGRSTRPAVSRRGRWRSLPGIRSWPFGLDLLAQAGPEETVLIAEGPTDWLALASRDRTTIGVPGAQAIATMWLRLLTGRRVVLAHDGDEAGELGAQLWRERLRPFADAPQRLPLPPGVDVCDYLCAAQSHDPSGSLPAPVALPDPLP